MSDTAAEAISDTGSSGLVTTVAGTTNTGPLTISSGTSTGSGVSGSTSGITYSTGTYGVSTAPNWISYPSITASFVPSPPMKSEQSLNTLTRAQVLAFVKHLLSNKKSYPVLESLIGSYEAPDLNDLIYISNLLSPVPREPVVKQNLSGSLNALKSLSNLLSSVSKELDSFVAEGRAEVVEDITK
jgi:hypothetical protein